MECYDLLRSLDSNVLLINCEAIYPAQPARTSGVSAKRSLKVGAAWFGPGLKTQVKVYSYRNPQIHMTVEIPEEYQALELFSAQGDGDGKPITLSEA